MERHKRSTCALWIDSDRFNQPSPTETSCTFLTWVHDEDLQLSEWFWFLVTPRKGQRELLGLRCVFIIQLLSICWFSCQQTGRLLLHLLVFISEVVPLFSFTECAACWADTSWQFQVSGTRFSSGSSRFPPSLPHRWSSSGKRLRLTSVRKPEKLFLLTQTQAHRCSTSKALLRLMGILARLWFKVGGTLDEVGKKQEFCDQVFNSAF